MTEINLATADKYELKKYAEEALNLNLHLNLTEEKMREKIIDKCNELGIEPPKAEIVIKGAGKDGKRAVIMIHKQDREGGSEPAFVSVQGIGYYIPRGIEVTVPYPVLEVLKNGVQTIVTQNDDGSLDKEDVPTFPYSVIREVA